MSRAGLTPEAVTAAAAAVVDEEGVEALSMARLARDLGVRSPSLYNHVDSLDSLVREIALFALADLTEACRAALMNRTGREALLAFSHAYRHWALSHPGTYPLTQVAHPEDPRWEEVSRRLLDPLLALLGNPAGDAAETIHRARALRSGLHGFITLELVGGFGLEVPTDASFTRMIDAISAGISV